MSLVKQGKVFKVFFIPTNTIPKKKDKKKEEKKVDDRPPEERKLRIAGTHKPERDYGKEVYVKKEKKPEKEYGKIVVYTCVTGGYEKLVQPVKTKGVDYVCFTDDTGCTANGWELRPIPEELSGLTKVKQQRMVKVCPHKYLPEYDISIWVDGSIHIKGDVKEFLGGIIYSGYSVFIPTHPARTCIYREAVAVKSLRKDTTDLPDKQMKKYKEEGFPEKYGLVQTNIIVRWHNNEDCIELMETWAEEIRNFSHRDQLSFNYAVWKTNTKCFKAIDKKTCNSKYFYWDSRHGKPKPTPKKPAPKPPVKNINRGIIVKPNNK